MALPWHKLNHKKQDNYIILAFIFLAVVTVGAAVLINKA